MKHHLSLPPGQLQVHLTRDEADAARLMAGPQAFSGPEGIERSWGSLEELLDGTRLPPYPRTVLKKNGQLREREPPTDRHGVRMGERMAPGRGQNGCRLRSGSPCMR